MLLEALELDAYDCMLITLNPADNHMRDPQYLDEFMKRAREKEIGVIAMKVVSRGALLGEGVGMEDLLRYALSFPVATAIVGISEIWQVDDNVRIAKNFRKMSEDEKQELRNKFRR